MGLEKDSGILHLPFNANNQGDIYHPIFPAMPSQEQESNFGALYLDNGPWITQNMDVAQPPLKGAHSSSATQFSKLESALSSHSQIVATSSRVEVPLPPARQRTAQACGKCRERKTKVCASCSGIYVRGYRRNLCLQCSGHRPVCLRCTNRWLVCEYSSRGTRLPTQSRFHPGYIRDPETPSSLFNYQPVAATRSRLDPLVDMCEPTSTMAFSSVCWDGYQEAYGDPIAALNIDFL
jgi:hypothetical protein